jgi:serine/threonine protein kinase
MQKKKIDNYIIYMDKKLGEGAFGTVYHGEHEKTHQKVAVKMLVKKASNNLLYLVDKDPYIKQSLLSEI